MTLTPLQSQVLTELQALTDDFGDYRNPRTSSELAARTGLNSRQVGHALGRLNAQHLVGMYKLHGVSGPRSYLPTRQSRPAPVLTNNAQLLLDAFIAEQGKQLFGDPVSITRKEAAALTSMTERQAGHALGRLFSAGKVGKVGYESPQRYGLCDFRQYCRVY
jgi:hypothetical protein